MDVGVTWDEASQTLVASPMVLDAGNLAALSAKIQAGNVSRAMFSVDSASVLAAAAGIEVGPLELSLRDAGAIDIALRDLAKAQGVTPDGARALMAEQLSAQGAQLAQLYPDLRPLVERLGDFIRTRGATLTIRMAPKAKVNLMQSITLARTDPTLLLPQFAIDAAVSKP
jgi:hypothetical protein